MVMEFELLNWINLSQVNVLFGSMINLCSVESFQISFRDGLCLEILTSSYENTALVRYDGVEKYPDWKLIQNLPMNSLLQRATYNQFHKSDNTAHKKSIHYRTESIKSSPLEAINFQCLSSTIIL